MTASPSAGEAPWIVVGLGNPGKEYAGNRHNVGAMAVAELAQRSRATLKAHRSRCLSASVRLDGGPVGVPGEAAVLGVPQSFMNVSGGPVAGLTQFYRAPAGRLIVLHDELDIPAGSVRLKFGGGEGGHNGLRSISQALGTKDYYRIRIGIGRPPGRMEAADFVLRDFSAAERKELPFLLADAADAVEQLAAVGLVAAQQRFHSSG